jgi:hypothetical protein
VLGDSLQHRLDLFAIEWPEPQFNCQSATVQFGQEPVEFGRGFVAAIGEQQYGRAPWHQSGQGTEELEARAVAPVDVLDDHQHWLTIEQVLPERMESRRLPCSGSTVSAATSPGRHTFNSGTNVRSSEAAEPSSSTSCGSVRRAKWLRSMSCSGP